MQHGFVLEQIAAHHIHVNVGAHGCPDVRVSAQIRHGALDFRTPDETQRSLRTFEAAVADQAGKHPRGFQNRDATTAIVVGTRPLVIEVAAINDLPSACIGAGYGPGYDRPMAGAYFRFYMRTQQHRVSGGDLRAQVARCRARHHEGKPFWQRAVQVTPAHDAGVQP
jgi:hypothetical protein